MKRIHGINKVVMAYFNRNPNVESIPAKDLVPEFIAAVIYEKDHRNGLPIRKDLRDLEDKEELDRIPFVHVVRKKVKQKLVLLLCRI